MRIQHYYVEKNNEIKAIYDIYEHARKYADNIKGNVFAAIAQE